MKKISGVKIIKELKVFSISLLALLFITHSFSQTNPWENTSKENPWVKTSEKEKSVPAPILKKDTIISSNVVDSLKLTSLDSTKTIIQSNIVTQPTNESIISRDNRSNKLFLQGVKQKANIEYKAPVAFVGSFLSGGVFLIFALPVNMLTSAIPTNRANSYVANYVIQNPKASKEEIIAVKKGIQKKRSLNSLFGSLTGMAAGITTWIAYLFLF